MLDDHGQPLNRRYSGKRLNDRTIDELIGISRGLIADKNINQTEAEFLNSWLQTNLPYCNDPIVNKLYCRVSEMLKDRVLDLDEQKELLQILSEFTGESTIVHCQTLSSYFRFARLRRLSNYRAKSSALPGNLPTGICEEVVTDRGGIAISTVTQKMDYLVVETFCSTDWLHTSYGRKIMKASEQREEGIKFSIISEEHWARAAFSDYNLSV